MSHTLFARSTFSNARVWAFLKQVDAAEARVCRSAGCPRCGGVLHSATYPRKPHGLAASLRHDARRFSFCCAACRRRVTPPSSRFFGRRFRVAPLVYLLGVIRGRSARSRLLRSLIWLLPWTGFCALGAGPVRSAESGASRHG